MLKKSSSLGNAKAGQCFMMHPLTNQEAHVSKTSSRKAEDRLKALRERIRSRIGKSVVLAPN
jgi:hypothetical protein